MILTEETLQSLAVPDPKGLEASVPWLGPPPAAGRQLLREPYHHRLKTALPLPGAGDGGVPVWQTRSRARSPCCAASDNETPGPLLAELR